MSTENPARITCSCPTCGAMTLPVEAFRLIVCAQEPDRSFYQFTCPRCRGNVTKQASERVVGGLSARGVTVLSFPLEALEPNAGPPLTMDDLLDLSLILSDDALIARALAPNTEQSAA